MSQPDDRVALGIAAEDQSDVRRVAALVDRLIQEGVDWIVADTLDLHRVWQGVEGEPWLDLHHAFRRARELGLPVYGLFAGQPGAPDAQMHRAVLSLFADEAHRPALVVIARDLDGDPRRAEGSAQASTDRAWPFRVLYALAQPEIEAWLLCAWDPEDEQQQRALEATRQELGFDPRTHGGQLTSGRQTQPRDAKRVLASLTASGRSAEDRWEDAALALLHQRGESTGLRDFIAGSRDAVRVLFHAPMPLNDHAGQPDP